MKNKSKTVDIFGTKYRIEYTDSPIEDENGNSYWGMAYHDTKVIKIVTKTPGGLQIDEQDLKQTLIHELMHAALSCGAYHDECSNEQLVEWLARCILAFQNQKII